MRRFVGRWITSWLTASTSPSGTPHRRKEMAHAPRAVGVLVAEPLLVAGRLPYAHALPVGLELVGEHHRQAGAHALPHLLAVADDGDRTIRRDVDEHQRVIDPA